MFTLSSHNRRLTAATLLVLFLGVFVGRFVCLTFGAQARQRQAHVRAEGLHEHGPGPGQPHAHAAAGHDHAKAPGPASPSDEPCCKDNAASFFASLTHPPKVSFEKPLPLSLALPPVAGSLVFARFTAWDWRLVVPLAPIEIFTPKIPDLRIFIRSLVV